MLLLWQYFRFYIFVILNFFKTLIILNIITILTNAIPFIRLDGYWILSFALGITNLYNKSLQMVKCVRPNRKISNKTDWFLLLYGLCTIAIMGVSMVGVFLEIIKVFIWIC